MSKLEKLNEGLKSILKKKNEKLGDLRERTGDIPRLGEAALIVGGGYAAGLVDGAMTGDGTPTHAAGTAMAVIGGVVAAGAAYTGHPTVAQGALDLGAGAGAGVAYAKGFGKGVEMKIDRMKRAAEEAAKAAK